MDGDVDEPEPEPEDWGGGEDDEREEVEDAADPMDLRFRGVCFGVWNRG